MNLAFLKKLKLIYVSFQKGIRQPLIILKQNNKKTLSTEKTINCTNTLRKYLEEYSRKYINHVAINHHRHSLYSHTDGTRNTAHCHLTLKQLRIADTLFQSILFGYLGSLPAQLLQSDTVSY